MATWVYAQISDSTAHSVGEMRLISSTDASGRFFRDDISHRPRNI